MFEAMYTEYELNPEVTRSRMYFEMLSSALPGVRLYVDISEGGVQKLLPLESFGTVDETSLTVPADPEGGAK